jgi:dethiobiotin synthetase
MTAPGHHEEPAASLLHGCFVAGTDTGVGKTVISAGLLHLLGRCGLRVAGYKPVAAGAVWHADVVGPDEPAGGWRNDDVEALLAAGNVELTRAELCPDVFEAACAPHLAARLEGRRIEPQRLIDGARHLMPRCDALVVEGVGGFCVPLAEGAGGDWGTDDLAVALALPVVLVVGLRLGCINHTLLTAQAIAARGLRLAGWIANRIDPDMACAADNIDTLTRALQSRCAAPLLGVIAHMELPDAGSVADQLDAQAVIEALQLGR